ncbi:GntR family transcriptional regulator [Sedimentitalea sp. JM2-8]|uniref:GntR family transcriptional regulator n=1 Tax=Sedimentitalea xiamensis TaxID=3050037 RepID=A0ABT7FGY9_9RHOB|nr:GntR family transcriptional regulator [Sedimentitalea xiamensis]MDK3074352.1 GntR family transcriptional regulator [Sedimentitalea xiamensis]
MVSGKNTQHDKRVAAGPRLASGGAPHRRAPSQAPRGPARFSSSGIRTSADIVYEKLHSDIASMKLRPGTPVSEISLAEEFGVSRTPVREALQRLDKEKLVEIVPKSGTFVGRIPVSAVIEAIVARRALEVVIVRKAVERATPSQVLEFRARLERQREIARKNDLKTFHAEDEAFHAAFASVAGYPGIWEIIRTVKIQVDRYRQLTLPQEGRLDMVIREHKEIVDALESGDADRAVKSMEVHLDKLQLDIEVFGQTWPDYFIHDREIEGQ